MRIERITSDKKRFLDLLLLADEQESMLDRYLERGDLFALYDEGVKAVCVVTQEAPAVFELKNIAVHPAFQGQGYSKQLVEYVCRRYGQPGRTLLVGTGDSPLTVPFYERCGFCYSHRVKNFFLEHYERPIFEAGRQLVDMVYLKKEW